jgi:glycosyltransferase involved in cell wall biosynthesis
VTTPAPGPVDHGKGPPLERLRVAVLSDAVPGRNGVGTYYDDLVESLRDRVAAIELVAPPARGQSGAIAGLHLPMPGDPTQSLFLPSPRGLWRTVVNLDPHVIVAASPWVYGWMALPLAREVDAGLCVGFHTQFGRIAELYWPAGLSRLMGPLLRWWDRTFLRLGDAVLVLNEDLAGVARAFGAGRVELMGTPAPTAFLDAPPGCPPRSIRQALFLGRLAPEKGIEGVLQAADDHPEIRFRLVGDGPLRSRVDDATTRLPNVEALAWVDRGRVLELIDTSDLILLPSRFETFGSAAYEGMLRRRAVLVSEGCGLVRWPHLGRGVFTLREGESVSAGIQRLQGMSAQARAETIDQGCAAARAMSEATLDRWLAVLASVARGRG